MLTRGTVDEVMANAQLTTVMVSAAVASNRFHQRERRRSRSAATKAASEEELDRRPPLDRSATSVEFPDDPVSRSRSRPPANHLAGMGLRIYRRD